MASTPEPQATAQATSRSAAEIGFAILLTFAAVGVATVAWSYPLESAVFPLTIAAALGLFGAWIGVRETLRRQQGRPTRGTFVAHGRRFAVGVAAIVLYIAVVSAVGFIVPSLIVGVALPAAVGFRRYALSLAVAATCVLMILVIFVFALERPLPPDILAPLWSLLR